MIRKLGGVVEREYETVLHAATLRGAAPNAPRVSSALSEAALPSAG